MSNYFEIVVSEFHTARTTRDGYVRQKLAFVSAAIALGSLSDESLPTWSLLFLAPFLAVVFDLYIAAEDFKARRARRLLMNFPVSDPSQRDAWVGSHRSSFEPFSRTAGILTSALVVIGALVFLRADYGSKWYFAVWLVMSTLLMAGVHLGNLHLTRKFG